MFCSLAVAPLVSAIQAAPQSLVSVIAIVAVVAIVAIVFGRRFTIRTRDGTHVAVEDPSERSTDSPPAAIPDRLPVAAPKARKRRRNQQNPS